MPANQQPDQCTYVLKILIIGDSGVGKSSLMTRFADNNYHHEYNSTIGVDFKIRKIEIDGQMVQLQIWDTAGQERFRTVTNSYYRGAHGVLVVYDVTSRQSFNHVSQWLSEIDRLASPDIPRLLVGTKTDLIQKRSVTVEESQQLAQQFNLKLIETSSKNDQNVEQCFVDLTRLMKQKMDLAIRSGTQKPPYVRPQPQFTQSSQSSTMCCWK